MRQVPSPGATPRPTFAEYEAAPGGGPAVPQVAVVADDLTGAADAGAAFLRAGLSATVTWATKETSAATADVLAIDTATRRLPAVQAAEITGRVVAGLREQGVPTLYKKVDSTLRGQIGAEVAAARHAWHEDAIAVIAPAFPATGRITRGGRQYVNGADLGSIADRLGGGAQVAGRGEDLNRLLESGVRTLVCDAETDADLRAIADAAARTSAPIVWVGSAGLAHQLAHQRRPALGLTAGAPKPRPSPSPGPALIVVGSVNPIAREQAADLVSSGVVHLGIPASVLAGAERSVWPRLAGRIAGLLGRGRDVVLTIDSEGRAGVDDDRLTQALGDLVRPCADLAGALIATGGDTATGILAAWNVTALELVDELEPGVPLSIGVRAEHSIPVATKAGAFGETGTLTSALGKLTGGNR